jgi:hypothetical protein
MYSAGEYCLLGCNVMKSTDVSEERITFVFKAGGLHKKETCCLPPAFSGFSLASSLTLEREAAPSSETSVGSYRTICCYIPEDSTLHCCHCENFIYPVKDVYLPSMNASWFPCSSPVPALVSGTYLLNLDVT